jgi:hypothetical protein
MQLLADASLLFEFSYLLVYLLSDVHAVSIALSVNFSVRSVKLNLAGLQCSVIFGCDELWLLAISLGRWFGQKCLVLLVNWMCYCSRLSCAGDALLDMIQLCKLNYLIQLLLLLVFWFLVKDLEDNKTRSLRLTLRCIGCGVVLRCMTIWSCAQQQIL